MFLNQIPVNQDDLPRKGDEMLYHYTQFESFKNIMKDLTLKPSSFKNLNDMNEGNVYNLDLNRNFKVMYETEKYIKSIAIYFALLKIMMFKGMKLRAQIILLCGLIMQKTLMAFAL